MSYRTIDIQKGTNDSRRLTGFVKDLAWRLETDPTSPLAQLTHTFLYDLVVEAHRVYLWHGRDWKDKDKVHTSLWNWRPVWRLDANSTPKWFLPFAELGEGMRPGLEEEMRKGSPNSAPPPLPPYSGYVAHQPNNLKDIRTFLRDELYRKNEGEGYVPFIGLFSRFVYEALMLEVERYYIWKEFHRRLPLGVDNPAFMEWLKEDGQWDHLNWERNPKNGFPCCCEEPLSLSNRFFSGLSLDCKQRWYDEGYAPWKETCGVLYRGLLSGELEGTPSK